VVRVVEVPRESGMIDGRFGYSFLRGVLLQLAVKGRR
jgi:hypothetical protein